MQEQALRPLSAATGRPIFTYKEACEACYAGKKMRLPEWTGYWFVNDEGSLRAFTRTGNILPAWAAEQNGMAERTDWEEVTEGLGFDFAILALKAGKKVCRAGWNGKGMFLMIAGGYTVAKENLRPGTHITPDFLESRGCSGMEIVKHIDMWTAQNNYVSGWLLKLTCWPQTG